ncbi:hypothetical protein HF086_013897 [Spodoptera exigua]|uniref:Uncharacterized protein n=1 Tax=Spodoptera exigua TaxID=7107 RepID=A0A922SGL6_SPOEX|nr:hypothetical protein HF086_013897 [Spodoptera exigua]
MPLTSLVARNPPRACAALAPAFSTLHAPHYAPCTLPLRCLGLHRADLMYSAMYHGHRKASALHKRRGGNVTARHQRTPIDKLMDDEVPLQQLPLSGKTGIDLT